MFRFAVFSLALALASVSHAADPTLVGATFSRIFVPGGFDSNDHVQFVGEGMFRNTCYRPAPGAVSVNEEQKTITVGAVAYEYKGFCLQVILPFQRTVDVGILKAGRYQVFQDNGRGQQALGEINIRQSRSDAADDFMYAPISQAFFKQNFAFSEVTLTGDFPTECMAMDHVKVTVEKDVIVLQPIAKLVNRPSCREGRFPFEQKVTIPSVAPGRYLLHVRSMNGNAVNNLINVELNSH